ncbi:hypothetical protein [[Mycoplasma] anseris]|uniref:Uncharacterized protein n=1 Tax=[Mycoplasma] anseris TaxID=92400 RepID=A0A2Z4NCB7_9BACT|nr:hypothetical protein [[Mycoplasma] anseris]AWX69189.1 hypothetical protein DP065_00205 [[Mycoplasma] anseris]
MWSSSKKLGVANLCLSFIGVPLIIAILLVATFVLGFDSKLFDKDIKTSKEILAIGIAMISFLALATITLINFILAMIIGAKTWSNTARILIFVGIIFPLIMFIGIIIAIVVDQDR